MIPEDIPEENQEEEFEEPIPLEWQLFEAIEVGNVDEALRLLDSGLDIETHIGDWGETPLMVAIGQNQLDLMRALLARGANVRTINRHLVTPLGLACSVGNREMVQLLLDRGVAVNEVCWGSDGTALMAAASGGRVSVLELLLEAGAEMEVRNHDNRTALLEACLGGKVDAIRFLLERGANLQAYLHVRGNSTTALGLAACAGNLDAVAFLLEYGVDVNEKDEGGITALDWATWECIRCQAHSGNEDDPWEAEWARERAALLGPVVELLRRAGARE